MRPARHSHTLRNISRIALMLAVVAPGGRLRAQDPVITTNAPRTNLEAISCRIETVVIKGLAEMGSMTADRGTISIRCLAFMDAGTGLKERGLRIRLQSSNGASGQALVDYEEIAPLLRAIETLGKLDKKIMGLPSFEADFKTKDGLRVSTRNIVVGPTESVQASVSSPGVNPIHLTIAQLEQFANLIEEARTVLDGTQKGKLEQVDSP